MNMSTDAPVLVSVPDEAADEGASISKTLPSGRKAVMRPPEGVHMIAATKLLKGSPSSAELTLAIINRVTLIDGKLLPFEDFIHLPLADLMVLQREMNENFLKGI